MIAAEYQKGRTPSDSGPPRVLVVDDNEAVRIGLSRYLQLQGFAVASAANGRGAIRELELGEPFSFVLTDLRLPDLEGVDVARRARELSADTWIGLVTGWDVDPEDAAFDTFDAVLQKPVDTAKLVARLKSLLGGRRENLAVGL